jgi:hypothetical protein
MNVNNQTGVPIEAETRIIQSSPDKIVSDLVIKRKMTSRNFRQSMGG